MYHQKHFKNWSITSNIKPHETSWLAVTSHDDTELVGAYGDSRASGWNFRPGAIWSKSIAELFFVSLKDFYKLKAFYALRYYLLNIRAKDVG